MANHSSDLEILDLDDLLSESDAEEVSNDVSKSAPAETKQSSAESAHKEAKRPSAESADKKAPRNAEMSASKKEQQTSAAKPVPQKEQAPSAAMPAPKESKPEEDTDALEIDFIEVAPVKKPQRPQSRKPAASNSKQAEPTAKQPAKTPSDEQQSAAKQPAKFRSNEKEHPAAKRSAGPRSDGQEKTSPKRSAGPRVNRNGSSAPRRPMQEHSEEEKQPFPLHLALLAAIVVLAVVAVVRFLVWNKGKELRVRSGENTDKYIIEVNDNMVYLSDSKLEGHEDDGVTTVLCLGNEPFSQDTSESGLAGQIAALGNCNVINAAFPDSQVTCENAKYSTDSLDSMDDIFNLFYVSYAISIGDFSSLETVASAHTENSAYQQSVDALKNTDFSKVDVIAIMYDGIDYINGMAMQNPDVPDELTTYVGSLSNSFKLLQDKYPYIRIVFMSPYYAEYDGVSSRTTDLGNGTIVNYFQWAYDTCGSSSVSFLDNYYGSVNENNYKDYLADDVHLNAAGCTKVADHFVYKVIQDNYAEYNVSSMAVAQGS